MATENQQILVFDPSTGELIVQSRSEQKSDIDAVTAYQISKDGFFGCLPVRYAGIVAFLEWLRRSHSKVKSIKSLSRDNFFALVKEFEGVKGIIFNEQHKFYWNWLATYDFFYCSQSDQDAILKIKNSHEK